MNRAEYLIQLAQGNHQMCANCKHYYEHYIRVKDSRNFGGYRMDKIDEGHCALKRCNSKNMKAWKTCEHWEAKEKD